ncbi:ATPase [Lysinibacillus sphaericus]|uniref:zonular occludens toxin domain-containing protein n=1 Tax=Lysinibacillus sphaericus TaxID=1421 RepID=UPI0018CF6629|nr:zonular occludens toxin domain-containing protein [Lysinibacillus sphaericus]MBG9693057.1 ATPase [Lysinibacillus sphaericus]
MHHLLIQGGLGTGKTLMMSILAHYLKEQAMKQGINVELFSNYDLKESTTMLDYTDWYKVAEADTSIICWDEAQVVFNNRAWSKFGQGIATEVAMYTRKLRSIQIYATPNVGNVDSRIRDIIEVVVTMRKDNKGYHLYFTDFQTKEFLKKAFIPEWQAKRIYKLNLYDTYSFVRGFPLPAHEKQASDFWEKLDRIHRKKMGISTGGILID